MATPTLDATPGGATANSYATAAEGDTYHDSRLWSSDWTGAVTATKTVALIMATRLLDATYDWDSWPTHPATQALQWPRVSMLERDRLSYVGNDTIPIELKNATAEFARQLIVSDRSLNSDITDQKLTALTAGPISLSFGAGVAPVVIPDAVWALMPPWWGTIHGRISGTRELVRV